jgi:hypothetical protein
MNMSKTLLWLLVAAPLAVTGCAHASAKTTPEMPALDMPAPPPRDVEPAEADTPPPAEPARNAPARPRPPAPSPRPEPPKAEPPPAEPAKPADEPARAPTVLQSAPATSEGDVERAIRASLVRATADLNRVDYRRLNADARTQYDTAKRFVTQAEDALRAKNLVFARSVADKAAALAAQLAGK